MNSQYSTLLAVVLAATAELGLTFHYYPWAEHFELRGQLLLVAKLLLFNYVLITIYRLMFYPLFFNTLRHLPGPKTAVTLLARTAFSNEPGASFIELMGKYPNDDLLVLNIFQNHLLLTKPDLLADLLVHRCYDFIKPLRKRSLLREILGYGLIVAEGDEHRFLRKNTLPAFGFRHIKNLYPMMWEKAMLLTKKLNEQLINTPSEDSHDLEKRIIGIVDIDTWTNKVTLDIIGIAGLGSEFNAMLDSTNPLLQVYRELLEPSTEKILYFVASQIFGLELVEHLPWKMNKTINRLTTSLRKICRSLVQQKRNAITHGKDDHFDILSLLIESDNFSDEELVDQLLTFLAAGHETTSSSLAWACYLLTKYPDMQSTLRKEISEALHANHALDEDNDIAGTLERLPYLNGIINETLRLYPTVPRTSRRAACDTSLGHHRIPKGTMIVVSTWALNRSPQIWGPEAAVFRPERWITDGKPNQTGGTHSNYQLTTFLHGPRSCIGQNFAKAELRCLLAAMVGAFTWELGMNDEEVVPGGAVTIKPSNGLFLRLKPVVG